MRRRYTLSSSVDEEDPPLSDSERRSPKSVDSPRKPRPKRGLLRWIRLGAILLHSASVLFVLYSFYFVNYKLSTSEECEMTYSKRQYHPIDDVPHPRYRLYKFSDSRDPRHKTFSVKSNQLSDVCLKNATIVLYIPGHLGDYWQSRSLGAHGIQLTGSHDPKQERFVVNNLRNNTWTGTSSVIENFVYDVYTVDLRSEPAGIHGRFLEDQSEFIATAVKHLISQCNLKTIIPVAHSIGGYSLLLSIKRNPWLAEMIPTVITLATPHKYPVFAFERTVAEIQTEILSDVPKVNVISLSGGLRDEMIPPSACEAMWPNSMALQVAQAMPQVEDALQLGMDHRAIVWCHNVLRLLRRMIFVIARSSPAEAIASILEELEIEPDTKYVDSMESVQATVCEQYGQVGVVASEVGHLYNCELFLCMYILNLLLCPLLGTLKVLSPFIISSYILLFSNWGYGVLATFMLSSVSFAIVESLRAVRLVDVALLIIGSMPLLAGSIAKVALLGGFAGLRSFCFTLLATGRCFLVKAAHEDERRIECAILLSFALLFNFIQRGNTFRLLDFLIAVFAAEIVVAALRGRTKGIVTLRKGLS